MEVLKRYPRQAPATTAIIAACVLSALVVPNEAWRLWGIELAAEPYRIFTSAFVHANLGHLTVNMVMLALIGRPVELALGPARYAAAYFAGILGSAAAIVLLDFDSPTVGASGAIFAVMVLLVGVQWGQGLDLRAPLALVVVNVAYTFLSGGVSVAGHVGGLLTGLALLPFLCGRAGPRRGIWPVVGVTLVCLASGAVMWAGMLRAGVWG